MRSTKTVLSAASASLMLLAAGTAFAADAPPAASPPLNWHAIIMFLVFVGLTPLHHLLGGAADQDGERFL